MKSDVILPECKLHRLQCSPCWRHEVGQVTKNQVWEETQPKAITSLYFWSLVWRNCESNIFCQKKIIRRIGTGWKQAERYVQYGVEINVFVVAGFPINILERVIKIWREISFSEFFQSGTIPYFIDDVYFFLECFKTVTKFWPACPINRTNLSLFSCHDVYYHNVVIKQLIVF